MDPVRFKNHHHYWLQTHNSKHSIIITIASVVILLILMVQISNAANIATSIAFHSSSSLTTVPLPSLFSSSSSSSPSSPSPLTKDKMGNESEATNVVRTMVKRNNLHGSVDPKRLEGCKLNLYKVVELICDNVSRTAKQIRGESNYHYGLVMQSAQMKEQLALNCCQHICTVDQLRMLC